MVPFKRFTLKDNLTSNFLLTAVELKEYIEFQVKRVYFIQDFKGVTSAHCHYAEDEFFIVVKGTSTAIIDQGKGIEEHQIKGSEAFFAGHYVWHGFKDISPDCIILALSSTNYNPDRSDYLENYEEYIKIRDEKLAEYTAE